MIMRQHDFFFLGFVYLLYPQHTQAKMGCWEHYKLYKNASSKFVETVCLQGEKG